MRIKITRDSVCGTVMIPFGEYWVSLSHESGEIKLSAGGKDLRLKATRRRAQGRTKVTNVQLYSGGGKGWSLVISTPKYGEWVAFLEAQ